MWVTVPRAPFPAARAPPWRTSATHRSAVLLHAPTLGRERESMTSVRVRTCAAGSALAVVTGLLTSSSSLLGADVAAVALLGVGAGAALGLVGDRSPAERALAFLAGFLAAWLAYALRAGLLPDIPAGRGLAVVVVVAIVTAVATATADRLPLWAGLLGAAALAGAYELVFAADPTAFVAQSTTAATSVLLAVAVGFVVATAVPLLLGGDRTPAAERDARHATPTSGSSSSLTSLLKDGNA